MSRTNVSVIMLTLNEADGLVGTLNSAERAFDELVLVDGGSTDGTVSVAENWADENAKDFDVIESTEREYLLEGPAAQRERANEIISNDYSLALGADVEVTLHDPEWFEQEFKYHGYCHSRVRASGDVKRDYRLFNTNMEAVKWRGIIHEELLTEDGTHMEDYCKVADAPMTHTQKRPCVMETQTVLPMQQRTYDGDRHHALKKQHYLFKRAFHTPHLRHAYLNPSWNNYYQNNKNNIIDDWEEIMEEYNLPQFTDKKDIDEPDNLGVGWWDTESMNSGEPVMEAEKQTAVSYLGSKAADRLGLSERTY